MTQLPRLASAALLVLAACAGQASAQALAPTSGRTLAATCTGCHGPGGHSPGEIPSIYGKTETQIVQALTEFRSDRRPATMMNRHAKGFTEAEIAAIAKEVATWR
ncbi:MAG: sulfide dehydrogenase [Rhodospirillales bacterium]|nr:sulfide dehydrogenase [Rhodospirillales bacterium]